MNEYNENNQNNQNLETSGTAAADTHTASAAGAADASSTSATNTNTYNSYQSGYYRNPTPHQDEPISSGYPYGAQNSSGTYGGYNANAGSSYPNQSAQSGYTNQTGSTENGYNFVNYYPNSNTPQTPKEKKPGSRKWIKVTAIAAALAVLVGGSFAGGYFMNRSSDSNVRSSTAENALIEEKTPDGNDDGKDTSKAPAATTAANADVPSWMELTAREGAMTVPDIVDKIAPSVVGIQSTFTVQVDNSYSGFGGFGSYFGFGDAFGGFGGNGGTQTKQAVAVGTGVVMSEDGYIVTNAHVVYDSGEGSNQAYGKATAVQVQMADQETVYPAEIVAYDVETDLAVLKVDQTGLAVADFGDSDECRVGEMVVAIGNPLGLELQNTVTCGIISALNREITINDKEMTLIQTDTAINNGNSGGPLINSAGQVIGINSAKMSSNYSSSSATVEGIGFAIPITEAKEIVNDLINYGYVTGRPQLGISCQDVSEAVSQAYHIPVGAYIISVTEGGAAAQAGLQIQDVIIAIDGQEISTTQELNDYKNEHNAGDQVVLTIVRGGQQMDVPVVLQEVVASEQQPAVTTEIPQN